MIRSSMSGGIAADNKLCHWQNRGNFMKENRNVQSTGKKKGIIETSVYCMNTKRKYIYELSGGVIVSERVIQCAEE